MFPEQDPNEQANISGAALAEMIDDFKKLLELHAMLRSYNPDFPMAPGMRANFLALRNELDKRGL